MRFKEGTIIVGRWTELTEEKILRLEIELIQLGRLEETNQLEYNPFQELIVKYKPTLELMDQQSQIQSNNPPPLQTPSSTPTIFGTSRHSIG